MVELDWKDICSRLKELRRKNSITIERLSEIIGVSTSFIGLVERGESGISIENLFKLSQVFNVSVDYILTGDQEGASNKSYSKFDDLNSTLFDYSEQDIDFLIDLSKFLKNRVEVRKWLFFNAFYSKHLQIFSLNY